MQQTKTQRGSNSVSASVLGSARGPLLLVLLSRFLTLSAMALYAASLGTTALAAYQETASLKQRAQIGFLNVRDLLVWFSRPSAGTGSQKRNGSVQLFCGG